jgi:hypothetical protein
MIDRENDGRFIASIPDLGDLAAYDYAEVSGWLVGAGEPPLSVAITGDGVRLLVECGLIYRDAQ